MYYGRVSIFADLFVAKAKFQNNFFQVDDWFVLLRKLNVTILHNENRQIVVGDSKICLAGVDDIYTNYLKYIKII